MLDTDTARDILVGKVPDPKSQVEQITIALIQKFMDDMDAESEERGGKRKFFTGDYARYGRAKLMAPSLADAGGSKRDRQVAAQDQLMHANKVRRAVARHRNRGYYNILASDYPSEDVSLTEGVYERDSGGGQDVGLNGQSGFAARATAEESTRVSGKVRPCS